MNRLTIEIAPEQHRQIKTLATYAGMTIKDFILAKTLNATPAASAGEGGTTEQLLASPTNAKRLRKAIATPSAKSMVFESVEDVRRALGV